MIAARKAMFEGLALPAEAGTAVNRRSRDLEDWEREPLRELGRVLREARLAAGLSVEDLGPIVGSAGSLEGIERGAFRTRASRVRPWLAHLGVDPEPIIERFAEVLAPERPDGRNAWRPVAPVERREPRALALPPLPAHEQAVFGAELWTLRVHAALTRPALAARLRVSRIHIWFVEHGQRRPSEELVDAWLGAAGRPVDRDLLALRFPGRIRPRRRAGVGMAPPDQSRRSLTGRFVAKEQGGRQPMTKLSDREIVRAIAESIEPIAARIGRLAKAAAADQARREAVRKRQLDDMARQVIAAYDQLIEKQIAAGVRKTRPVRKAGMTLAERLQEIADEAVVEKRSREMCKGLL
jgi:transcriptional regulator with XRE-family HTH domain